MGFLSKYELTHLVLPSLLSLLFLDLGKTLSFFLIELSKMSN